MKKFLIVFLLIYLSVSTFAQQLIGLENFKKEITYADNVFSDNSADKWFYNNVVSVYEYGLMNGVGDGKFDTVGNVTLAEAVTIAVRINCIYTDGALPDFELAEDDLWYEPYIRSAERRGVLEEEYPAYNIPATRAEFAKILAKSIDPADFEEINTVVDGGIPDVDMESDCAEAVYMLYRAGILTGSDQYGSFKPDATITRAEAAAIITRIVEPGLRQPVELSAPAVNYTKQADILAEQGNFKEAYEILYEGLSKTPTEQIKKSITDLSDRLMLEFKLPPTGSQSKDIGLVLTDSISGKNQDIATISLDIDTDTNNMNFVAVDCKNDTWLFYGFTGIGSANAYLYTIHSNSLIRLENDLTTWTTTQDYIIGEALTFAVGDKTNMFVYTWDGLLVQSKKNIIGSCFVDNGQIYYAANVSYGQDVYKYELYRTPVSKHEQSTICSIDLPSGSFLWLNEGSVCWFNSLSRKEESMRIYDAHNIEISIAAKVQQKLLTYLQQTYPDQKITSLILAFEDEKVISYHIESGSHSSFFGAEIEKSSNTVSLYNWVGRAIESFVLN